ncbi:lipid IV(A) 3-deoxy-D-manno-octulosonic acid transferase [Candidatus Thioglobus autotrophicus]|uniref:lipid IV(A) 3-deoxy-D-manno-octulosonic acid transferase n=1 Tax=Candidatus Thioglobus autotrophicus TaxID=1705394 RepID=UPI00299EB6D8|nr:lipid IV(A) 3-deoxy-D-manno-octulosonic acid transferase [Candidatus Thioglobus autotrophicus]WPE15993.1 lipid IV(A) 3-deoxy-D-manno-octulosonic acid transferase [Candidatus Thioglobus autotrophicus]
MNRTLYSLVGYLLLPILIIRLFVKSIKAPSYRKRVSERLGLIQKISTPTIWVHCVSVGEFRAAITLIDTLIKQHPQHKILVTTTTPTGSNALKQYYGEQVLHHYFPFDLSLIVKRYIKRINPDLCILMETEIWPNLIHALKQHNIPSILINARLSARSLEKYQKYAPTLIRKTLNDLSLIATQNQNSAARFIQLGAPKSQVVNTGNIKFDLNPIANSTITAELKQIIGQRKVVAFASTHAGEELQIINSYLKVQARIDALLVIIPRHPERFNEVEKLAKNASLTIARRSNTKPNTAAQILLGDSMGEMLSYFSISDVVFMGGSLNQTGGHNMLEPAALSKPIIFGPSVFNFAEISSDLLNNQGAIQVQNADELLTQIIHLLGTPEQLNELGSNAKQYFDSQQGAVKKIAKLVESII